MYLAVRDGLDVPVYLGSRSTFALGQFGGHAGRTLRVGDMLPRVRPELPGAPARRPNRRPRRPSWCRPMAIPGASACSTGRMVRRTFKPEAIDAFFAADWEVHYNPIAWACA